MSDIFAKKGEQVWNYDHTEGYEFTEDIIANTPSMAHQVKALGLARDPIDGDVMPEWFARIVTVSGGIERYRLLVEGEPDE